MPDNKKTLRQDVQQTTENTKQQETTKRKLNTKDMAKFYNTWQNNNKEKPTGTGRYNKNKNQTTTKKQQECKETTPNKLKQFMKRVEKRK